MAQFGFGVTQALQGLRSLDDSFDEWWAPVAAEMKADELARYFWELRIRIGHKHDQLQDGKQRTVASGFYVNRLNLPGDLPKLGPRPPGASRFFMGDGEGRSGWIVVNGDGSESRYFVEVPPSIGYPIGVRRGWPPISHQGRPLTDSSPAGRASAYVGYLAAVVDGAKRRFG